MHLGMLQLAVETFELKDYEERFEYCLEFYPFLVRSYIDQAITNYVKPLIVNYHNHYSSFKEVEEIYYERTNSVVYKYQRNDCHICWETDKERMVKDRMFYSFKTDKLVATKPAFLLGPETPLLCRALRYGLTLKLEDLYMQYESGIDLIVHKMRDKPVDPQKVKKAMEADFELFDQPNPNEEEVKLEVEFDNCQLSPIKGDRGDVADSNEKPARASSVSNVSEPQILDTTAELKCNLVDSDNFHFKRCEKVAKVKANANETKTKAKKEQIMLNELYNIQMSKLDYDGSPYITQMLFQGEIKQLLIDNHEVYDNLSKYIVFSEENKRFFDVEF